MKNSSKTNQEMIKGRSASKQKIKEMEQPESEHKRAPEAMHESKEFFKVIIQNASDIILVLNNQGTITYVSPSSERFLGYAPDELIGKSSLDLIVSDDKPRAMQDFGKALQAKEVAIPNVFRIRHKDGTERILEGIGKNLLDDPIVAGFVMNVRDITERKRIEEEGFILAEIGRVTASTLDIDELYKRIAAEIRKLILLDSLRVNLFNAQQDMLNVVYVSGLDIPGRRMGESYPMRGTVLEEVIRTRKGMIVQSENVEELINKFPSLIVSIRAGIRSIMSVPLIAHNELIGSLVIRSKKPAAYTEQDLQLAERIGMQIAGAITNAHLFNDIKKTEGELRESEERFRSLFEQAAVGVAEIEISTSRFITVNRRLCEIVGRTEEEMLATTSHAITHPEDTPLDDEKRTLLSAGKISQYSRVKRYLRKDGESIWVNLMVSSLGKPGEESGRNMIVVEDITERKRAEQELVILAEIGRVIGSTLEIGDVYEQVVAEMRKLILFDSLIINFFNVQQETLDVIYASGLDITGRRVGDSFPLRGAVWDEHLRTRRGLIVQAENPESLVEKYPSFIVSLQAGIRSIISIPLITKDEMIGTLFMRSTKPNAYTQRDLHLAEKIGMEISGAIANARLFSNLKQVGQEHQRTIESLRKAFGTTVRVMVSAVETRDPYTSGHQTRSADLSRTIGTEMGLPQEKIDAIRVAGSIHDIGKLSIPAEILSKPTKLSDIEFSLIKEHARKGYEMLKDVESPWPLADIVYQHHERMDGSGYPRNLKGEDICIEARILAVADVVEAMSSHRPYRPSLGLDAALNEIEKNSGICYDNTVADACLRLFREKGFQLAGT